MECSNDESKRRPKPEYQKHWFSAPETCLNPDLLPPFQQEIFDQIHHFEGLEKIDPKVKKFTRKHS